MSRAKKMINKILDKSAGDNQTQRNLLLSKIKLSGVNIKTDDNKNITYVNDNQIKEIEEFAKTQNVEL